MRIQRRWGVIATGVALALAFIVLIVLGTVRPDGGDHAASPDPSNRPAGPSSPTGQGTRSAAPWMHKLAPGEKPPQFLLFSFDGVGSHEHWQRVMATAKAVNAHVTGFLSGVYLLPRERANDYTGPGHKPGASAIGFGGSDDEVE